MPQTDDRIHQMRRRRPAVPQGRMRALHQARSPKGCIPGHPLVARFPAYLVAFAEFCHRPQPRTQLANKINPSVHRAALLPRHQLGPSSRQRTVTHLTGLLRHLSNRAEQGVVPLPQGERDYRLRRDDLTAQSQAMTPAPATRAESFGLFALAIVLFATAWPMMKIGLAGAPPI